MIINLRELPEWASRLSDGDYMVVGTQLCTRDGRIIGNARVTKLEQYGVEVVTDMGTAIVLDKEELIELFHKPEYIMKLDRIND